MKIFENLGCIKNRVALIFICTLLACADFSGLDDYECRDCYGAAPGGVQDMNLARKLVASGRVPPAEAFSVGGIFAEHDLPLTGERCAQLFCPRAALAIAPNLDGQKRVWVQLGMTSTQSASRYVRPKAALIALVDVSGSMGWNVDTGEYPTPAALTRRLLTDVASRLEHTDQLAILSFSDHVTHELGWTAGDQQVAIQSAVRNLSQGGETDMAGGFAAAVALARQSRRQRSDVTRVLLFTDAQPNIGRTSRSDFEKMVDAAAAEGIELTVFGMGVGLGQDLMVGMSRSVGGNAFSFFNYDDIEKFFVRHWPLFLHGFVQDLKVSFVLPEHLRQVNVYGAEPSVSTDEEVGFEVATVFLSRRRGALLLELGVRADVELDFNTQLNLSYIQAGARIENSLPVTYQDRVPADFYQTQLGVGRATALAVMVTGMQEATRVYAQNDRSPATQQMIEVTARIKADAQRLADPALEPEVEFAQALLRLMERDAPQGRSTTAY